jgi:hypothetical protein
MIWIWVFRIVVAWVSVGCITLCCVTWADVLRGEGITLRYFWQHRAAVLYILLAAPVALWLIMQAISEEV